MRVLYLDANVWHINPTANLLPALVRERFPGARFYGPGFVDEGVLAGGLQAFAGRYGPFDVAMLGPATPFLGEGEDDDIGAAAFLRRYASHRLSDRSLLAFFADVRLEFGQLPFAVRLISLLNFDYYAASQKQVDVLLKHSISVLGPNDQFVLALADLPDFASREKHYVRKVGRFTDVWLNFLRRHPERIVTATHFVGPQEYCFDPLAVRPYEVAIPGAEYLLRKDAVRRLSGNRLRSASKVYFHFYRLANRLGLPAYSHPLALRLYNLFFQQTLFETRCIYTARGGFGMPIRKFFEIPAAGGLLICNPCTGYADLGFEIGRHYVQAEPDALLDVLSEWLFSPDAQKVARTGQQLVIARHSMAARGEQIERCLRSMVAGTYRGARWCHGEYLVDEVSPCAA
ncbi:glycosyltransferase family 1 protein [Synechococcus sp. HJ21-Hayes]|uniref:glycosyltransferase family protein n=1 Tax=unclassified Synechococcus TaxID=2626047 RepID=UPI0020CB70AA|nr:MULTISPECIES: glycosyltransferase [unclassified Synechococcus]MCP9830078.1 glycosyltransferase family 1 protein [Synechococcus sp. JJ3a-Johnson]MCP9852114.1 glycosyltransferase family 1 protein [Synechococcus sp. HJ21-Hayes]